MLDLLDERVRAVHLLVDLVGTKGQIGSNGRQARLDVTSVRFIDRVGGFGRRSGDRSIDVVRELLECSHDRFVSSRFHVHTKDVFGKAQITMRRHGIDDA